MKTIEEILQTTPRTARSVNFDFVLRLLNARFPNESVNIVETGCARNLNDSGDGHSTLVWQAYLDGREGKCWTVDISEKSISACRKLVDTRKASHNVTLVCDDSLVFLKSYDKPINLLYLDSYDTDANKECCIHQVRECQLAMNKVVENGIIMLDDVFDGGKSDFSIPYLKANGWKVIQKMENQAILSRT